MEKNMAAAGSRGEEGRRELAAWLKRASTCLPWVGEVYGENSRKSSEKDEPPRRQGLRKDYHKGTKTQRKNRNEEGRMVTAKAPGEDYHKGTKTQRKKRNGDGRMVTDRTPGERLPQRHEDTKKKVK